MLGVYVEAFEARLRLPIPPFLLSLLRYYNISLCTLILNYLMLVLGFLIIYILAEVWPFLTMFHAFYTIKRYPYSKDLAKVKKNLPQKRKARKFQAIIASSKKVRFTYADPAEAPTK